MAVGAIIAVAGTAYSMYENAQAAEAQAAAERQMQAALNEQAGEVERRGKINRSIAQTDGEQFMSRQSNAFSANGVDVGASTGSLDFLAYQRSNLGRQIELQRQQTAFDADQTRKGIAASEARAAEGHRQAGVRSAGSLLQLGSSLYGTYCGGGKSAASTGSMSVGTGTASTGGSYSGGGNYA